MNQLQLAHQFETCPDRITVRLNDEIIYTGDATITNIDFVPVTGLNKLTVTLDQKSPGNFFYNSQTGEVEKNSKVAISEIIVESRYFKSLVNKCGLVEIDLSKNLNFPSKYLGDENILTMEGSEYLIKFEYPVKHWMQIHRNKRDLTKLPETNQKVKKELKP